MTQKKWPRLIFLKKYFNKKGKNQYRSAKFQSQELSSLCQALVETLAQLKLRKPGRTTDDGSTQSSSLQLGRAEIHALSFSFVR